MSLPLYANNLATVEQWERSWSKLMSLSQSRKRRKIRSSKRRLWAKNDPGWLAVVSSSDYYLFNHFNKNLKKYKNSQTISYMPIPICWCCHLIYFRYQLVPIYSLTLHCIIGFLLLEKKPILPILHNYIILVDNITWTILSDIRKRILN